MKHRIRNIAFAGILSAALLLAGCSSESSSSSEASTGGESSIASVANESSTSAEGTVFDDVTIKVGATPVPHAVLLEQLVDVLADQGITLEIIQFDDYVMPNTGLEDGSLDANFFQHLPYLETFNEEHGTSLVSAAGIHIEPLGVYPGKRDALDDLEGALIGIPDDSSNGARALLLLEYLGVIELDEAAGLEPTVLDIANNPYNVEIKELEAVQLPASLPDLDFAVINGNYAMGAGIDGTVIANENADSPYVNIVAVREGDESRPEIQALLAALQSDEIAQFIEETYGAAVVPVF